MSELELLRDYISTLEKQNTVKNKERETLYRSLQELKARNEQLQAMFGGHHIQDQEDYIAEIESRLQQQYDINAEMEQTIQNFKDEQERFIENIELMELKEQELSQTIRRLQSELESVKESYSCIQKELKDQCEAPNMTQLIENYEKIEIIARQKYNENEKLKDEIYYLKSTIAGLQERREERGSVSSECASKKTKNSSQPPLTNIYARAPPVGDIIRQNNRLIERVTILEREKNTMLAELTGKFWIYNEPHSERSSMSYIKNSYSSSMSQNQSTSGSKVHNRIEALRQENDILLDSLKLY